MGKGKKGGKSWFNKKSHSTRAHEKMLEKNSSLAKEKWVAFVDEMRDLGYSIVPALQESRFPGMYQTLISLKGMSEDMYDRHKNPAKWAEIDKKANEEASEKAAIAAAEKIEADQALNDMGVADGFGELQGEDTSAKLNTEGSNENDNESYDEDEQE